jgi:hypothetical protein
MTILGIEEGQAVGEAKSYLSDVATGRRKPMTRAECARLLREWASKRNTA